MSLVADTGGILALHDADDRHHEAARRAVEAETGLIVVPMAILGELDYMLRELIGIDAELDLLDNLARGAYTLEPFTVADIRRCQELIATYRDLNLGIVDAAVVATAERLGIRNVLTVDERHFRAVRPKSGTSPYCPPTPEHA